MDPLSRPARSWLFVPANRPERFAKAAASGADRMIVDLEDAVAAEGKVEARARLATAPLPAGLPVYLRINGPATEWFADDVALAARLPFAGLVLPKADGAAQVARVAASLPPGRVIVAIVETAVGLWNVLEVARAPGVERLAFGAVDLQLDLGARGDALELAYARSRLVLASRVAGIAPPLDSVSLAIEDAGESAREAAQARRFGFAGKLCIHPRQIAATHQAFLPSADEVAWAEGLLVALAARGPGDRGAFSYRGGMVDRPVIERARQILSTKPSESAV